MKKRKEDISIIKIKFNKIVVFLKTGVFSLVERQNCPPEIKIISNQDKNKQDKNKYAETKRTKNQALNLRMRAERMKSK